MRNQIKWSETITKILNPSIYTELKNINDEQHNTYYDYVFFDVELIEENKLDFQFRWDIKYINIINSVNEILQKTDKEILPFLAFKPLDYFTVLFETQKYLMNKLNKLNVGVRLTDESLIKVQNKIDKIEEVMIWRNEK